MAFLSDIHGNVAALGAVLEALDAAGVRDVFVAGDLLYGGDEPLAVWKKLVTIGAKCTQGISDAALANLDPDRLHPTAPEDQRSLQQFRSTRQALGDLVIERLRRLPKQLRIPLNNGGELVMQHGSPADATQEISHDMTDEEILTLVADDPADIIVCGSSHVPFDRMIDGVHVVNVGSVGAAPEGRIAHYGVVISKMDGVQVELTYTSY